MAVKLSKGNDAVIVGALYAGCDCFFGYPITPASEILHAASAHFPKLNRTFLQAESEEAAINMVYGAAATGHRVMTSSSGPGISLMQEGFSYIAAAELPAVIINIQRAGPGLGNIGPEQTDYNQIVKGGGHGAYRSIVLAPNSVQEMCDMTREAFELAEKWRNPVVVLADAILGQMTETLKIPDEAVLPDCEKEWSVAATKSTRKNLITSIYLDFDKLEDINLNLQRKYETIKKEENRLEAYLCDDADIVLTAYGISSRIARQSVDTARNEGIKAGLFRPKTLFPFPEEALATLGQTAKAFISVEMSDGQMLEDVRKIIGTEKILKLVNRFGGNLINQSDLLKVLRETASGLRS